MKIFPAFLGLSSVAAGAFGAHKLKPQLVAANTFDVWQTAVQYQLIHAVALLAIAVALVMPFAREQPRAVHVRWLLGASWAWAAGVVFFSGSLYWVALGGPHWLWPFAPAGGILLMAGWACVIAAAIKAKGKF